MQNQPNINENFITKEESSLFIEFIENNIDLFSHGPKKLYYLLQFGKDNYHQESIQNWNGVDSIKNLINKYIDKIINNLKESYGIEDDLFVVGFWFVRQFDGASLNVHDDTDSGRNTHIIYSALMYLNDIENGGELWFPNLNYLHKPKRGQMLSWPSQNKLFDHGVKEVKDTRYVINLFLTNQKEFDLGPV
jgi:hypothetical protein